MKKVEVILDPEKLDEVRALLQRIGVDRMTVTDVRSFGSDLDHSEFYRGAEHRVYHLAKMKVEIFVEDGRVPALLEQLERSTRSGRAPEERIFVLSVDDPAALRVTPRLAVTP